ncbi:MAG: hypothetical protein IT204_00680 [Fimbriimonadaceae bacterium]|nr:hypothetical protein [Fimbriimonadaceae bacterium]
MGALLVLAGLAVYTFFTLLARVARRRDWWWLPAAGGTAVAVLLLHSGAAAPPVYLLRLFVATAGAALLQTWLLDRGASPPRAAIGSGLLVALASCGPTSLSPLLVDASRLRDVWLLPLVALTALLLSRAAGPASPAVRAFVLGLLGLTAVALARLQIACSPFERVACYWLALLLPAVLEEYWRDRDVSFGVDPYHTRAACLALLAALPLVR